jgi:hypothetical protein
MPPPPPSAGTWEAVIADAKGIASPLQTKRSALRPSGASALTVASAPPISVATSNRSG